MKKLLALLFFVSCSAPTTGTPAAMFKQGEGLNPAEGHPLAGVKQGVGPSPASLGALCFSPGGNCDLKVVGVIDGAKKTLDAFAYALNRQSIVDALVRAKKRSVVVRVLLDRTESGMASEKPMLALLTAAGIPLKRNTHKGIMHIKSAIADGKVSAIGSYNWTNPATLINDEVLEVSGDENKAAALEAKFEQCWSTFAVKQ